MAGESWRVCVTIIVVSAVSVFLRLYYYAQAETVVYGTVNLDIRSEEDVYKPPRPPTPPRPALKIYKILAILSVYSAKRQEIHCTKHKVRWQGTSEERIRRDERAQPARHEAALF